METAFRLNKIGGISIIPLTMGNSTVDIFDFSETRTTENYYRKYNSEMLIEKSYIDSYMIDDMYVDFVSENNYYLCHDKITNMYGIGDTESEAKDSYRFVILDYFEFLRENKSDLSNSDKKSYNYLKEYISKM